MSKIWDVSRGPIHASEIDVQKADVIRGLLVDVPGVLPVAVGDKIRPFAIGIFNDFRVLLKPDTGVTKLRRAIGAFVHTKRYYLASAQPDAMRHDINGREIEPVSEADRQDAQEKFRLLRERDAAHGEPSSVPIAPPAPTKAELIRQALLKRPRAAVGGQAL